MLYICQNKSPTPWSEYSDCQWHDIKDLSLVSNSFIIMSQFCPVGRTESKKNLKQQQQQQQQQPQQQQQQTKNQALIFFL